jgi:phosphoenolpyruvate synthase/pyruvate phosphate dikinase
VSTLRAGAVPAQRVAGDHVVPTESCLPEHVASVGGKAVGLGSLLRAGQRVPASFVVSAGAYRDFVRSEPHRMSAAVREAIARAYSSLSERHGGELTVAVRSSATVEDAAEASWAGQFQTFLGIRGADEVVASVEQCWAAAMAPHVGAYRADRRVDADGVDGRGVDGDGVDGDGVDGDGGVAVIVQELVDARISGVMFTQHPQTGDRSLVVIESSYGLGEAVVGGEVTPDLIAVNKITGQRHHARVGAKHREHRLGPDRRGVQAVPVDPQRQQDWSISEPEVAALVTMAAELEARLGRGLDVEWAVGATGNGAGGESMFALQVRPITVSHARPQTSAGQHRDPIDHILGRLSGPRGEDR